MLMFVFNMNKLKVKKGYIWSLGIINIRNLIYL